MAGRWTIQLLGGLSATQGERVVSRFRTRKTGALLAYLAFYSKEAIPRERLMDALWPDSDLLAARNSLSVALSSLRAQLEPPLVTPGASPLGGVLVADRSTIRLHPDAFTTDVAAFEAALKTAQKQGDVESFSRAVEHYAGELLPGFFDDWMLDERERLDALYQQALRRLIEQRIAVGAPPHVPKPDGLPTVPQALPQFAPPAVEAKYRSAPPPAATRPIPDHLPVPLTRFFGQEDAIQTLLERLRAPDTRLVTLTGPGGGGKTRLALEAARREAAAEDGSEVWFVPLADMGDTARFFEAIRDALLLPRTAAADALHQIVERLKNAPSALLVLDNLEHLLGRGPLDENGTAAHVRRLLARLPRLRILATSRQSLGLDAEQKFPVSLLPVPGDVTVPPAALLDYASVQLFVDRARNRRVDFQITPYNAEAVAQIVIRLEGIPLAIELAAAWSRLLSPAQMRERLSAPFEMLVSPSPRIEIPERQRTLWGALAWGYDLLPPDARRAFAALSVFRGEWSAAAAEAVCESTNDDAGFVPARKTLECLTLLQAASLLVTRETEDGVRFRLLEPVREFAHVLLEENERETLEQWHAAYFVALAEEAYQHRRDKRQKEWFDRLEASLPNLHAVFHRFGDTRTSLQLASLLGNFCKIRGYYRDGIQWITNALAFADITEASARLQGQAWDAAAILHEALGDFAEAASCYEKSRGFYVKAGSEKSVAAVLNSQGHVAYRQSHNEEARNLHEQALEISRRSGNAEGLVSALCGLGNIAQAEAKYEAARHYHEECLMLAREMSDTRMISDALNNLGCVALCKSDTVRARVLYEESLLLKRGLGDRGGIAMVLSDLGDVALREERISDSTVLLTEAVQTLWQLGDQYFLISALEQVAHHAAQQGKTKQAGRLWGAADAARPRLPAPREPQAQAFFVRLIEATRAAAPAVFDQAWQEGSALSLDDAAQNALSYLEVASQ